MMRMGVGVMAMMAACSVCAAESGRLLVESDLKREPFIDAPTLQKLQLDSEVAIIKRQGGWMRVQPAAGESGWLKLVHLKLAPSSTAKGDDGLGALWHVARSGRSGNSAVTVSTGVRGLDAEAMKNARPDPAAVEKLKTYAALPAQAERFAEQASLQRRALAYLTADGAKGGKK